MAETSSAAAAELIDSVGWSLQYKEYLDQLNQRAEEQARELTPQEQEERQKIQEKRLHNIFSREVKRVKLNVEGHTHTNTEFLLNEFDFTEVHTIADACQQAQKGVSNIESLGIVEEADILVDTVDDPEELAMTINVKEVDRRRSMEIGFEHNSINELCGNVGLKFKNVLGNAETLTATASLGKGAGFTSSPSTSFNFEFFKPRAFSSKATLSYNLFRNRRDRSLKSSCLVDAKGADATYTTPDKTHAFTYGIEFREMLPMDRDSNEQGYKGASGAIMGECNEPSLKSSIRYAFVHDKRDNRVIPTMGHALSASAELAGLGGDAQFVKMEGAASYHKAILDKCTVNMGIRGGLIAPLGKYSKLFSDNKTRICDRVLCGGDLISRGYKYGIGPRQEHDYLDSDLTVSAGISATGAITDTPLYWHGFLTATGGSIGSNLVNKCLRKTRVSLGASVVLPIGGGRLELGLMHPLTAVDGDQINRMFWGFGMEFL